jgi:hypothetical protein
VPEVVVHGPCRDDQRIVSELAVGELKPFLGKVEVDDLGEQHRDVSTALEDRPEGMGDVGGRQATGRDLIEKRLKEVEVAPIDERDSDRRAAKSLGGVEAAEAPADDDDPMLLARFLGHTASFAPAPRGGGMVSRNRTTRNRPAAFALVSPDGGT